MKICDKKLQHEFPPVPGHPVPGRVYQVVKGDSRGDFFILDSFSDSLVCVSDSKSWAGPDVGFNGDQDKFRDVTDYVCLDVSRLPPLEDDE